METFEAKIQNPGYRDDGTGELLPSLFVVAESSDELCMKVKEEISNLTSDIDRITGKMGMILVAYFLLWMFYALMVREPFTTTLVFLWIMQRMYTTFTCTEYIPTVIYKHRCRQRWNLEYIRISAADHLISDKR